MKRHSLLSIIFLFFLVITSSVFAAGGHIEPAFHEGEYGLTEDQYAKFPLPLGSYGDDDLSLGEKLSSRAGALGGFNIVASIIFLCAILHTFLAGFFLEIAHKFEHKHQVRIKEEGRTACAKPQDDAKDDVSFRAHLFHFLGEVEAIFGIWVIALAGAAFWFFGIKDNGIAGIGAGFEQFKLYLAHDVNFVEPVFVVIIMAIAATRPVVRFAETLIGGVARMFGGSTAAWWVSVLTIAPILGSFITEPAAMTIAALLLAKRFFSKDPPVSFKYATIGLLFVNISVGGTLTHFAAPPVLMVQGVWNWDMSFMFINYGWKAVIGIIIANTLYFFLYRKHFASLNEGVGAAGQSLRWADREDPIPAWVTAAHIFFLAFTVMTAHDPVLFILGFIFFLGFTQSTGHHQNNVDMKSPLLVGFFLAGLVIHGKCQSWWIAPLITSVDNEYLLMIGSTVLTAFNDNAAITYLASQAPGLAPNMKYAVVAGAVTGGGLTVIANAPNPAGQSILGKFFDGGVKPAKLAINSIIPTIIMGACFMLLRTEGIHQDTTLNTADHKETHGSHADDSHEASPDSDHNHTDH